MNALRIGNSERVAKAGASSVFVYTILEVDMRCFLESGDVYQFLLPL